MLSVREDLINYLMEQTGLQAYYNMPPVNVGISMPILILEEVENSDVFYRYYDDETEQEMASVSYEISIYTTNPQDLIVMLPIIDRIMKRIGFKKSWTSGDNHVEPLYCKSMRFTGKIKIQNGNYMIYSR